MSVFPSNVNIFLVLDPYCCCLDLDLLMASGTVLPKGKLWHFNTAEFRIRMDPGFFFADPDIKNPDPSVFCFNKLMRSK